MKKSLLALAVLAAFTGAASAQSTVTIYGKIDLGLVLDSGNAAGKSVRISSGVASGSRLGFRGEEDLGGGNKASFVLETGFCADSASTTTSSTANNTPNFCTGNNQFMGRLAHGDLSGAFGTLTAGRQYSLAFEDEIVIDPFNVGYAGRVNNIVDPSNTRLNNAFRYTTPIFSGFKAAGEFALGEQTGDWEKSREMGANVSYGAGPAYVSLSYYDMKNANGQGDLRKNYQLGGTYDFHVVKVHALVQKGTGSPTGAINVKTFDFMGGVTVPVAGGNILASYIRHNDEGALNRDANQIGIGYNYPLSKRTSVYGAFARIVDEHGATFLVGNNTETGTGTKAFNLGVLHNF